MRYPSNAHDRKQARRAACHSLRQYLRMLHIVFKNSLKLVMERASYSLEDMDLH